MDVKSDCRHLKGDIPCNPHKTDSVHCSDCSHYNSVDKRILIIKLDGIGDVIRTTPILRKLKSDHPKSEITWLTSYPEVLPKVVDFPLMFDNASTIRLLADSFDLILNFDKRHEACALTNLINAKQKKGFILKSGKCAPADDDAMPKYMTGLFDDLSKANPKSYVEEIFDIAGLEYNKEKYLMASPASSRSFPKLKAPVIGFNTGCSDKWLETRSWSDENWIALAKILQSKGFSVVLLGGEREHKKNLRIAAASGAHYFGNFPLSEFLALVNSCDLVVTSVTSTLHMAIALERKIVLFVNIFPKAEFELYGLGEIIEPPKPCECYFKSECSRFPGSSCMKTITPDAVADCVKRVLTS